MDLNLKQPPGRAEIESFAWILAPLWIVFSLVGCSLLVSTDFSESGIECEDGADCEAAGFVGSECVDNRCSEPPFACADDGPPLTDALRAPQRTVSIRIVDGATQRPVRDTSDLSVRLCALIDRVGPDGTCERPVLSSVPVNIDGRVAIPLEAGFLGYLEVQAPGFLPTIILVMERTEFEMVVFLFSPEALRQLGQSSDNPVDLRLAQGFAWVLDCDGNPAPGLQLRATTTTTTAESAQLIYQPDRGADRTTDLGTITLLNFPERLTNFEASLASTGRQIGIKDVPLRGGWNTYFAMEVGP